MTKQQRVNHIPLGVIAGLSAAAMAAGGVAAWWTWDSANSPPTPRISTTPQTLPSSPSLARPPIEQTAQIYWLKNAGDRLELVPNPVTVAADQPNAVLETAFNALLAGRPTDTALSSTIPQGTKLRGVKMQNDGIHVDLSEEFTTGGGSASMTSRVAQVLYTATSLQPTAKVWIDVEGKPLEILGGEGLELEQPLTRQSFKENFSL